MPEIFVSPKTFSRYKINKLNNRCDQILFYSTVMNAGMDVIMVAGVGRRPLAHVLAQFALWASADDRHDMLSWFG